MRFIEINIDTIIKYENKDKNQDFTSKLLREKITNMRKSFIMNIKKIIKYTKI